MMQCVEWYGTIHNAHTERYIFINRCILPSLTAGKAES